MFSALRFLFNKGRQYFDLFSWTTRLFALWLILSAAFMLQIFLFLRERIGEQNTFHLLWIGFLLAGLFLLWRFFQEFQAFRAQPPADRKRRSSLIRFGAGLFLRLLLFALVLLYAWQMENRAERFHIITYSALGFLMCRDALRVGTFSFFTGAMIAFSGCFFVAGVEELFQYFLPYRFGELRDVWLGLTGALPGILVYMIGPLSSHP